MAHAFDRDKIADSETSWLAIHQEQKIEVRSKTIRAKFELLTDRSILVRMRSADSSRNGAFASVCCDFGALLELFAGFCDSFDFQPFSEEDATVHALSQVGHPRDLSDPNRSKSVAQLRKLRSFDKFHDEIKALTQIESRLREVIGAFSGLMSRYERSKYNRGNAAAQ